MRYCRLMGAFLARFVVIAGFRNGLMERGVCLDYHTASPQSKCVFFSSSGVPCFSGAGVRVVPLLVVLYGLLERTYPAFYARGQSVGQPYRLA